MDWQLPHGEAVHTRHDIAFATGLAPKVAGLRSFRDPDGRDIETELTGSGWPPGPGFQPRDKGGRSGVRVLDVVLLGVPRLINAISNAAGPGGSLVKEPKGLGQSREPHFEVDDFPVVYAGTGAVARTLPWQLDPARRPKGYRTDLLLTDRRLVILGLPTGSDPTSAQELWSLPRSNVAGAELMTFSQGPSDVRLRFTDESWTRWCVRDADRLVSHVRGERRPVTRDRLTPQQRARVAALMTDPPLEAGRSLGKVHPVEEEPQLELLSGGVVAVHLQVPLSNGSRIPLTEHLDPSGADVAPEGGNP
ncbi:hypothetical protein C9F11_24040 [Streptomyces sp. YIM 121038]|uniref:hypothetical protein n=1 Tax=Streptomyces sp. YIM 121038 TaxID=2136401 RepID=UPI00111023A7|nr:hypothetical protein [Streptomyces sp. YIM 121038]QCX78424.1 hypothetical protein C9F11_24040 [Streptomyces sp. YIM 121038]